MVRRLLVAAAVAAVLSLGIPTAVASAQSDGARQEAQKAGKEAKEAGKAAGRAARHAGKAATHAAKHAAKAVKQRVKRSTVTATCNDGTTYTGATRRGACAGHRGVKTWGKP